MQIEPELLDACLRQDRLAQSELFRRCFSMLMGICMRYAKDEEQGRELLNLGFLKILNNLSKRKPGTPLEPWMRRVMINAIIDEYRKHKKHKETMVYTDWDEHHTGQEAIDFNMADRKFDAEDIEMMIQGLPPMTREVFNLHIIDGYAHKEIAKMLGIAEGTSKWHVNQARKKIQGQLMEQQRIQKAS
ncbi:MAG: RNA polymerase sigma factor [Bacteroidota bacterium]